MKRESNFTAWFDVEVPWDVTVYAPGPYESRSDHRTMRVTVSSGESAEHAAERVMKFVEAINSAAVTR